VTPYIEVDKDQYFVGTLCLHLQGITATQEVYVTRYCLIYNIIKFIHLRFFFFLQRAFRLKTKNVIKGEFTIKCVVGAQMGSN